MGSLYRAQNHRMASEIPELSSGGPIMGFEKLIALAATLAILAASTGQLPRMIYAVHLAELHLLKESQASNWGKAILLP